MRYGRLQIWLNDGDVKPEIMADMFGGNFDNTAPFANMKPEIITKGVISQLGDMIHGTSAKIDELDKDIALLSEKIEKLRDTPPTRT